MATFKKEIIKFCEERGMFSEQAEHVFERVVSSDINASMSHRWNDSVSGYPPVMLNLVLSQTKREALAWIDENAPLAWFRPMFE
jgi:hypothetical protein